MDRKLVFKNMPGSWHTGTDFKKVQLTRVSWDKMPNHALAYVFFGYVIIDFDGSPTAYGPEGIVPEPDDDLGNAGNETQGYFGVVAYSPDHPLVRDGTILIDQRAKRFQGKFPVVQQAKHHDPKPGYYVSTVSRWHLPGARSFPDYFQNNYTDASKIPFGALDGKLRALGVDVGDCGMAIRHDQVGLYSAFYYLDKGGSRFALGECSHRVGKDLGGSGRASHFDNNYPVSFIVFPGHGNGEPAAVVASRDRSDDEIRRRIQPRVFELSRAINAKDLVLLMGFNETPPGTIPQGLEKLERRQTTGQGFPANWATIIGALRAYGFVTTQPSPKPAMIF
jgi:hypothetical protein